MLFSSAVFLFLFLPLVIILYFLNKNITYRNIILLIFSLIFYSWGEPKNIIIMILTTLVAYVFGLLIDKYKETKKSKILLIISIILILSSLFVFKYLNFSLSVLNSIFSLNIKEFNLVLPIGISFYTFQILSYIIDLYRQKIKLQKNPFILLLYVTFFPQLIAGPIVRYETIEEEMKNRKTTFDDFIEGFKRLLLGLFKKVLIANTVAIFCDYIYSNLNMNFGSGILWLAAIAYCLQIYYDFSGYSDMAIGLGRIFGFHFLENFNYPYLATSITDFWRRWHISLSSFFKDYLYIPLGGSRVNKIKYIRNVFIVWFLTGLWHGANFNYVFWGLYFCLFLLLEKIILKTKIEKMPKIFKMIGVWFVLIISFVIFRLEDLSSLGQVLKAMFILKPSNYLELFRNNTQLILVIPYFILGIIFSTPIEEWFHKKVITSNKCIFTIIENLILLILFAVVIMKLVSNQYNPFIYFRF